MPFNKGENVMSTATVEQQLTKDQADILALLKILDQANHDKDAAACAAPFAPDAILFDLDPPLAHHGVEIRKRQAWLDSWATPVDLEWRDLKINVSGDLAFGCGFTRMSGTKKGAEGTVSFWMRSTVCLERHSGSWRIVHTHTSVPFYMDGSLRPAFDLRP
jgi:ketosteroid isomerase-like protein